MSKRSRSAARPRFTSTDAPAQPSQPPAQLPGQLPLPDTGVASSYSPAPEPDPTSPVPTDFPRLAVAAVRARERSNSAELEAVRVGRALGLSWDWIGAMLDRSGETLRRQYAHELVGLVLPAPETPEAAAR